MANKCHQKHKGRLRQKARERYQNLSEEETERKQKNRLKQIPKFY